MRLLAPILSTAVLALSACAPMEIATPFDASEAAFINNRGNATVTGQAFLRQAGGGVVTCAGSGVGLVPATGYATELFTKAWGNSNSGVAGPLVMGPSSTPPEFQKYVRKAQCDAEGDFEFTGVPNGTYYVVSQVTWMVPGSYISEGGVVGKRITVTNGRSQKVIVTG